MNYKVSVYITTKNRPLLLKRAIASVLSQTYRNLEIIIIDDNSDVDSYNVVHPFIVSSAIPIVFIRNERSQGACFCRNLAILSSKGHFVTGLDDDDEFLPDRIQQFIDNHDSSFSFLTANDLFIRNNGVRDRTKKPKTISQFQILTSAQNLVGNQIFVKKSRIIEMGGFDVEFPSFQDFDCFYRLIKVHGPAKVIEKPSQIVHRNNTGVKISSLFNQFRGLLFFYLKHSSDMNLEQKKAFLFRYRLLKARIIGLRKVRISFFDLIKHSNRYSYFENLRMYISLILKR